MTLTIGSFSVFSYAVHQTNVYEMNQEAVYNQWTDANGSEHRDYIRTKISGHLTVVFLNYTDYSAFMTALNAADHVYSVTATISNTGSDETFTAYVDVSGAITTDLSGGAAVYSATIEVTQL